MCMCVCGGEGWPGLRSCWWIWIEVHGHRMHLERELAELAGNLYKEGRMRDKQRPSAGFFI